MVTDHSNILMVAQHYWIIIQKFLKGADPIDKENSCRYPGIRHNVWDGIPVDIFIDCPIYPLLDYIC